MLIKDETLQLLERLRRARLGVPPIGPGQVEYEQTRRVWNAIADRRPAAIVRARSVADVTRTIAVAAEVGCLLAVRCGGHSFPGFSTCDDGIVLDLAAMKEIVVDPVARTAHVGGGSLLGDLDRAGSPHGLVTPAGVVSHTGAAGLTLGGGMGWLSRRLGLTIDSLLEAEVCTADGRVVIASAQEESELFWGLRGGGGNFGVVTRFKFRMHELGSVLVGSWTYPFAQTRTVLRRYAELAAAARRPLTTAFTVTAAATRVTAVWSGSTAGAEEAVKPYGTLGVPTLGAVGGMTFLDLQSRSDEHFAWGRRYYAKGGFLGAIADDAVEQITAALEGSPAPDAEIYVLQLGGAISDNTDDATAYTGRAARFYWIVEPVWDAAADDERCIAWGRVAAAGLAAVSASGNYVNEQSEVGAEMTRDAYGEHSYRRLAALKARFDPDNLFRLNQNVVTEPGAGAQG